MIPNILSIAGSDPSGGAGIQADIKSISANGGYAMAVITALTAQNTQQVSAVTLTSTEMITAQIAAIQSDIRIDAVKIGMLGTSAIIETVAEALDGLDAPVVVDPVMVAKGGDRLLEASAVEALRDKLVPKATVITPNLPEAADLLGEAEASSLEGMRRQGGALLALGPQAVLLKGGHLAEGDAIDLLVTPKGVKELIATRTETKNTHGTGCTLSSALATQIGLGNDLPTAAERAKRYVSGAIIASDDLNVGSGHGPLNHFYAQ